MRIVEWTPRYARHLADLWNASDAGWPSGLVRGRPKTPGEAREWERRSDTLARYLAVDGGRPVGYVRLLPWWGSPDGTYVQWLNVDPRYQNKGIGKALLLKAIEKTIDLGQPRIDLHTWPGNEKAMPLYKRTGFMWVPASHAYLQNFIPLILGYEPARSFFARHAWLGSLERDLERAHDEDSLHGIDAFVYRFRAGRERLEAVIDRNAREVMAFEDAQLRVEAWIPDASLVESLEGRIHWLVRNKARGDVSVVIDARGTEGLKVACPPPFVLGPGKTKEVRGSVTTPDSFPDPPEKWPSPAVESVVTVGGRPLRLQSGFRPKPALDIGWERHQPPMASPGSRRATLLIRNQAGRPLRGALAITGHGLQSDPARMTLAVVMGGIRRIRVSLRHGSSGNHAGRLRVVFESPEVRVLKNLAVPCLAPGGMLAYAQGDTWCLATPLFRLVSKGVGAESFLELADGTKVLGPVWVSPGPPFWPSDTEYQRWEGRMDPARGAEIIRRVRSKRRPGLVVEQRWRVVSERVLELRTALENRGTEPWSAALTVVCDRAIEHPQVTIPPAQGLFREAYMESEWPDQRDDVPLGRLLAEDWIHFESKEGGCGILWESGGKARTHRQLDAWSMSSWRTPEVRLLPNGRHEFPPARFLVTRDWRDVRSLWAHVTGRELEDRPMLTGSVSVTADPGLVLASPAARLGITLRNLRQRPVQGTAQLDAPKGLGVPRGPRPVRGLRLGQDWTHAIRLRGSKSEVTSIRLVLDEARSRHSWEVPVVVSDGGGSLRIQRRDDQRMVENRTLSFAASGRHGGSLISLRSRGHEYLVSTYPRPGSFSWFRPFYGGIHPMLFEDEWPGDLHKERFRPGPARRGTWSGVAMSARTKVSSLPKGIAVRLEYLTRPRSPLLAVAMRVQNGTKTRRKLTGGFWTTLGLDGKPSCEVEFERLRPRHWRAAPWTAWTSADDGFAVFRAPESPLSVAVTAAEPGKLEIADLGRDGRHGIVQRSFDLDPGESATLLATLALVPDAQARAYRVLRGLTPASFEATRPR